MPASVDADEEALMADYLLFATERYALPILQPLAQALQAAGHGVHAWFVDGARRRALPAPVRMVGLREAVALNPRAVFSAANWVPPFRRRRQGAAVPWLQRREALGRARTLPGAWSVRSVLHAGAGDDRAVPGAGGARRATSPWSRPAGPSSTRCSATTDGAAGRLARAGRRASGGDVRVHLHRAPECRAAPVRRDRRRSCARRSLLAADPAPEMPAGAVRALSRAGGAERGASSKPSNWSPRSAPPTCCWPTPRRWSPSSSCSASRW